MAFARRYKRICFVGFTDLMLDRLGAHFIAQFGFSNSVI